MKLDHGLNPSAGGPFCVGSSAEIRGIGNGGECLGFLKRAKGCLLIVYAELGISGLLVADWRWR